MDVYPQTRMLWGKCLLCNKWWDSQHAAKQAHKNKLLLAGIGEAVQERVPVGENMPPPPPAPLPVLRDESARPPAVGAERVMVRAGLPVADDERVRVILPPGCTEDMAQVAFLVDSFHYMKKLIKKVGTKRKNWKFETVDYLPGVLEELRVRTGLVCMAICSGGAQLVSAPSGSATYQELLDRAPSGLKCLIAVVCGNDLYSS